MKIDADTTPKRAVARKFFSKNNRLILAVSAEALTLASLRLIMLTRLSASMSLIASLNLLLACLVRNKAV